MRIRLRRTTKTVVGPCDVVVLVDLHMGWFLRQRRIHFDVATECTLAPDQTPVRDAYNKIVQFKTESRAFVPSLQRWVLAPKEAFRETEAV